MRRRRPEAGHPAPVSGPLLADPRRALGWAGLTAVAAVVLFLLMWSTAGRSVVQHVDDAWLELMEDLRWQPLVDVAKVLSFLGGTICNWSIRIAVILILIWRRQWLHLTAFVLAVVCSEVLIGPMKALYDRPRPPGGLIATSGASFPSGHAVSAAVTAVGLVIVLLPPGHTRWTWERRAAFYASLMALSRTYLGVHWLSDVVAGALIGCAIAIGCPAVLVELRVRAESRRHRKRVARE
ncbi:MAG: phosphatase PAP2 family protein [Acidimicrobiia bacterium]